MQSLLLRQNFVVAEAAHHLLDFGDRALDGFEDLQCVLVQNVEGALDAVVGNLLRMAVIEPGGENEQDRRQDDRGDHHQLQEPNCGLPCSTHRSIISWFVRRDERNLTSEPLAPADGTRKSLTSNALRRHLAIELMPHVTAG